MKTFFSFSRRPHDRHRPEKYPCTNFFALICEKSLAYIPHFRQSICYDKSMKTFSLYNSRSRNHQTEKYPCSRILLICEKDMSNISMKTFFPNNQRSRNHQQAKKYFCARLSLICKKSMVDLSMQNFFHNNIRSRNRHRFEKYPCTPLLLISKKGMSNICMKNFFLKNSIRYPRPLCPARAEQITSPAPARSSPYGGNCARARER